MGRTATAERMLHVRFEGHSLDLSLADLGVQAGMNDGEIRAQVASYLNVKTGRFADYVVDRHRTGNLTLRPAAVYG